MTDIIKRLLLLVIWASVFISGSENVHSQEIIISEFLAENKSGARDDLGGRSDWIELYNQSPSRVSLSAFGLKAGSPDATPWIFPSGAVIESGQRMIVYASGSNRRIPNHPYHTDFQLSLEGEYLALVRSNGSVVQEFSPAYPPQVPDISYAVDQSLGESVVLLNYGAEASAFIPENDSLENDWIQPDFDDSQWKKGKTGIGYDYPGLIGLDVSSMRNKNESVYIRIPFDIAEVESYSRLVMALQYEDGMVAYLNGRLIASRNVPNSLEWDSGAPQNRPDSIATAGEDIIITEFQSLLKQGRNLLAFHGLNNLVTSSDILIRPKITGFIQSDSDKGYGYSYRPTPREPNTAVVAKLAPEVIFSQHGTTFNSNLNLDLGLMGNGNLEDIEIRYTDDGSIPDKSSSLYSGTLRITSGTTIRARSFGPGGAIGPIRSETYTRLSSDARTFSSNLPLLVLDTNGRSSIPQSGWLSSTFSIFEPDESGRTRFTSQPVFSSKAGIRVRGSSTAGRTKASLSLELWDEFDEDKNASLLGMPSESDWILWGPYNFDPSLMRNPLVYELSNQAGRYAVRTRFVELFMNRDGDNLERSDYFGVYVLMEKISRDDDRVHIDKLFPEQNTLPEITGGYIFKIDRTDPGDSGFSAPGNRVLYVEPKEEDMELPENAAKREWVQRFFNDLVGSTTSRSRPVPRYHEYLNVDASIDHHILNVLAYNVDALRLSTYMTLPRNGKLEFGPVWDFDRSQGSTDGRDSNPEQWRATSGDRGTDFFNYPWWRDLFEDLEFYQRYIDRWQELNANQWSKDNIVSVIDSMAAQLREAALRNEERWGRFRFSYNMEINHLKSWYSRRIDFMNSQFVDRPEFSAPSQSVEPGYEVTLESPEGGTIYYTLDGSDPRAIGGRMSPDAIAYRDPIVINDTTRIMARVFKNTHTARTGANNPPLASLWSGPATARFSTDKNPAPGDIIITEIHYHPLDPDGKEISLGSPDWTDNEFEFIELKNISEETLDINGLRITEGVTFDFKDSSIEVLEPGARLLLVSNLNAFHWRYGGELRALIGGSFTRSLSKNGESIVLSDSEGKVIWETSYRDDDSPLSDGPGFSLVLQSEVPGTSGFNLWRSSSQIGGSPGEVDPAPPLSVPVVVNEVLLHSDPPLVDSVELVNNGSEPADISGWLLSDDLRNPGKYQFPQGTVLDPNGFLVLTESDFNSPENPSNRIPFSLSALGDEIYLFSTSGNGRLSGYLSGSRISGTKSGESIGRHLNSIGEELYVPQKALTFGSPNSEPRVGPVIISELMYAPPSSDATPNLTDEFIEIVNPGPSEVPLFINDPTSPAPIAWRLRGGIDYDFPPNITLAPGQSAIILAYNPSTNPEMTSELHRIFEIPEDTIILGPFSGNLDNKGERVSLKAPGQPQPGESPEAGAIPYFTVDEVIYSNDFPWPDEPNGNGASLTRVMPQSIGSDPAHWASASPTPGRVNFARQKLGVAASLTDNGALTLSFETVPGFTYHLLVAESVTSENWTVLESFESQDTPGSIQWSDPDPVISGEGQSEKFYQIRPVRNP